MIEVTYCGYNSRHLKPREFERRGRSDEYLMIVVKADAVFAVNGKQMIVAPGTVFLFSPGTLVYYRCDGSGYNDDWIHFRAESEEDVPFLDDIRIPLDTPLNPLEVHRLSAFISDLTEMFHARGIRKPARIDSMMRVILYTLEDELEKAEENGCCHKYYPDFRALRTRLYNEPSKKWSTGRAADTLSLSISHFQHLYKTFFGCPFQQDIIRARIEFAKFCLLDTDMSIGNLAEYCGYESEIHFMRQFKKTVGMTPSGYRKMDRPAQINRTE